MSNFLVHSPLMGTQYQILKLTHQEEEQETPRTYFNQFWLTYKRERKREREREKERERERELNEKPEEKEPESERFG